jgi:putative spermidine/putrescine transport system permease protein
MNRVLRALRQIALSQIIAAVAVVFLIAPFVLVIGASFDRGGGYQVHFPPRTFSLAPYEQIPLKYMQALGVSTLVGCIVAIAATVLGLLAALGIVRGRLVGKEWLQAFFRLPVQIPAVVTGAVFLQFYYQVAALLDLNLTNGIAGLVLAHLFVSLTYSVGAISAVLSRMDWSIEEAAQSLGASNWNTFAQVTFPRLRPGLVAGMFYAFIMSFGDVPIAMFLVNAKTMTLPVQLFQDMQFDFRPSMLAISTIVALLSLTLILGIQRIAGLDLVAPSNRK